MPYLRFYAVPKTVLPLFPTSKRTMLPNEVPTARYLMLFEVITVEIPTPLEVESKAAVTFFSTMKSIFLTSLMGGNYKFCILLHLSMMG